MMEIGLIGYVPLRPIRKPTILAFDDGSQRKPQWHCVRRRQSFPDGRDSEVGFQLQQVRAALHGYVRYTDSVRRRHTRPVRGESIGGPLPRGREIELVIPWRVIGYDERFEARVLP